MFANNFLLIHPTDFSQYLQKYFLGPINKHRGVRDPKILPLPNLKHLIFNNPTKANIMQYLRLVAGSLSKNP